MEYAKVLFGVIDREGGSGLGVRQVRKKDFIKSSEGTR